MAFLWYRHLMRAFLWVCRVRQGGLSQNIVTSPQERCDPCHSIQCWIGLKAQTRVRQAKCQPYVRLSFKGWRPPSWVTHRHSERKKLEKEAVQESWTKLEEFSKIFHGVGTIMILPCQYQQFHERGEIAWMRSPLFAFLENYFVKMLLIPLP